MTRKELKAGMVVYHSLQWNWGRGIVVGWRDKDHLGYKIPLMVSVKWIDKGNGVTPVRARQLRKTCKAVLPEGMTMREYVLKHAREKE